jgi:1,4-dihydroxy-2-naphthoate octaprenyltransferase
MIRNLFDTLSVFGVMVGMACSFALITKFPVFGFILFMFIAVFSLITLVNASSDG